MIVLIAGASHVGKTKLAQYLMEKLKFPYLSIDHLKMGLIRSGNTDLTPLDDVELEKYLWPIIVEIVKTAIENQQNLIIEGMYIPFDWKNSFTKEYLCKIRGCFLIMSSKYIKDHFSDIKKYANIIENRQDDSWYTEDILIEENLRTLEMCENHQCKYFLIDNSYDIAYKVLRWLGV